MINLKMFLVVFSLPAIFVRKKLPQKALQIQVSKLTYTFDNVSAIMSVCVYRTDLSWRHVLFCLLAKSVSGTLI